MVASHGTGGCATRATELRFVRALVCACVLAPALAACGGKRVGVAALAPMKKTQKASATGGSVPTFPDTGINATTLTVTGIEPASGPFAGGNLAVIRGSGFTADAIAFIGGNMVQPANTQMVDRNSLQVVVPAGNPGTADVSVMIGPSQATKAGAYTYNPLLIEPASGSVAGNTSILITSDGADFDADTEVTVGGQACSGLVLVTPSQVRCRTPAGNAGQVDVSASWPMDPSRAELLAKDAFEYVDLTDTDHGGLDGGPINGTVNVAVVDSIAGLLVPNAFVLLGDDVKGPYQGRTDKQGHISFTGEGLVGPVTVHVAAKCMESASIVAFDAQNVTVHVTPLLDPACGMPGDASGGGRGMAGALISGELIFPGANEFTVNSWDVLPEPRANESRVAYVFTTRVQYNVPNPSPAVSGATARVVEETSPVGTRGYPYKIFARPAGLAVYAISGLERRDTGAFTPYVMGVARNVLTSPGAESTGVDIHMDLNLDQQLGVSLAKLPDGTPHGPDQFVVQANVDLGGEGVIVRVVNGNALDLRQSVSGGSLFRFFAQPGFSGSLADGRYLVVAGWYSGDRQDTPPYTQVVRTGVKQSADPLVLDDFLALPRATAPPQGSTLPKDRVLRWEISGKEPDMFVIDITGGNDLPAWSQLVPGSLRASAIPDFSSIDGLKDIAPGLITWTIRAVQIDGFDFNELKYNQLSPRFWTHTSIDSFTMQR